MNFKILLGSLMKQISILSFVFSVLASCASLTKKTYTDGYPDEWWQEIPKDQLASWEIGPQAADRSKSEVVLSKRNKLGLLSNLTPAEFTLDGEHYASVESLWQAMKYPENKNDERLKDKTIVWPYTREQVMKLSGFEAKKAGDAASENMKKLGIKWITYKGQKIDYTGADQDKHYDIILRATRAKVENNPSVRELLMQTGDLKLLADHTQKPDSPPAYRYFDIAMKLRAELKAASGNSPK